MVYVLLRNQMTHFLKGKYNIQQTPEPTDTAVISKREETYKQPEEFIDSQNEIELVSIKPAYPIL